MRKTSRITRVAGIAFIALVGIAPAAQSGTMGNGGQQRNQAAVNRCLAMPHDKMMNDQGCKSFMVLHPELFPAGSLKPQNAPSH
jgi:ABC-type histidine transport system ATPase subunit